MGRTERVALKHVYHHKEHRWPVGSYCATQELSLVLRDNLEGCGGGGGGREVQEGRGICISIAGSCCVAETNTALQNNYPPTENLKILISPYI